MTIRFTDSHCHLDITLLSDAQGIAWIRDMACLPVSWSYSGKIGTTDDLRTYFSKQRQAISLLNDNGLRCYYLCGIHPRDIPGDLREEMLRELLMPYLDDHLCLGIGEIGLETGSNREKEILAAHLDMAGEVVGRGKVFGIHTPRRDKAKITGELLKIIDKYIMYSENIVVDHCTGETIASVLEKGLWAGVTMNPEKCRPADLVSIVEHHKGSTDRIMLNTDSSTKMYRDLHELSGNKAIDETVRLRLIRQNALRFYHLE